jgi:2-polyprenyl-3-methyl-5-hydroxy-6-metoxy-1,4-benzoquinol methylase
LVHDLLKKRFSGGLQMSNREILPDSPPGVFDCLLRWIFDRIEQTEFVGPYLQTRIFDVGCGNGALMSRLRQEDHLLVAGCDIMEDTSPDMAFPHHIELDLDRDDDRKTLYHVLTQTPQDIIVCSEVLEHLHAPLLVLKTLFRALKPGGYLMLSFPNAFSDIAISTRLRSGYSRWYEPWSVLSEEAKLSYMDTGRHVSVIDPVVLIEELTREFPDCVLERITGNNLVEPLDEERGFISGWVPDERDYYYWLQLAEENCTVGYSHRSMHSDIPRKVIIAIANADCLLMEFRKCE